jgi:hypothetical protein
MPPSRRPIYARRLARVIVLNDGTAIVTLLDAVRIVREQLKGVELAIEQLAAAKSGGDADIAEATDTLERVLRAAPPTVTLAARLVTTGDPAAR